MNDQVYLSPNESCARPAVLQSSGICRRRGHFAIHDSQAPFAVDPIEDRRLKPGTRHLPRSSR